MSTVATPPPQVRRDRHYKLGVNTYDRVSSLLVSLLVMVGVIVLGLVIVFFARRLYLSQVVRPIGISDPRPDNAAKGFKQDMEPPGLEDAPDLIDPQLQDTLNTITESLNASSAILSDEVIDNPGDVGKGSGFGDSRASGAGGEGGQEPAREIRFKPSNPAEYAKYLDHFKIELAVLGRDNKVYYAYNLIKSKPDTRVGDPLKDNRLWMNSAGSPSAALDKQLVQKAGIAGRGSIILQFYPPETQAILFKLEEQKAGRKPIDQIKRTVYRVARQGNGFAFSVESQEYF